MKKKIFYKHLVGMVVFLLMLSLETFPSNNSTGGQEVPRIMYGVSASPKYFAELKAMGITHVHTYGLASTPLTQEVHDRIDRYLNLAHEHNLKVMFDLNGNSRVPNGALDEMRSLVNKYGQHPAVGIWYLSDEPDNHKILPRDLLPYYEMIKEESPSIPVAVCHAWTTNWYRYNDVQDLLLHDIYPVTGAPFPNAKLDNQTNFTHVAVSQAKGKPAIPVLQFFNWESMAQSKTDSVRGYSVNSLRYPSMDELRYLSFSTVGQGVRGLAFYSYARSVMTDASWPKEVGAKVLNEVAEFLDVVNTNQLNHEVLSSYRSDGYLLSVWKSGERRFVMLANTTNETKDITHTKHRLNLSKTRIWGNSREIDYRERRRRTTFKNIRPWEIVIWEE